LTRKRTTLKADIPVPPSQVYEFNDYPFGVPVVRD
jgi:hypothetical protein